MTSIAGRWEVRIKTPIGTLAVDYRFEADGTATATLADQTVPLQNVVVDGSRVTWRQSVRKPIRLNLEFDVLVDGQVLAGHSRAGRLPKSQVTGRRVL
ncbi:MAG: hypothetical protein ABWY45_20695 [Mycobacterium sp.]